MSRLKPTTTRVQQRAAEEMTMRLNFETARMEDQLRKLQEDLIQQKAERESKSYVSGVAHWRSGAEGAVRGEYKAPRKLKQTKPIESDANTSAQPQHTSRTTESNNGAASQRSGSASSSNSSARGSQKKVSHSTSTATETATETDSAPTMASAWQSSPVIHQKQSDSARGRDAESSQFSMARESHAESSEQNIETIELSGDFHLGDDVADEFITVRNRKSWQFRPLSASRDRDEPGYTAPQSQNLLQGTFDESESQQSFQDALKAWRGEQQQKPVPKKPQPSAQASAVRKSIATTSTATDYKDGHNLSSLPATVIETQTETSGKVFLHTDRIPESEVQIVYRTKRTTPGTVNQSYFDLLLLKKQVSSNLK